MKYLSFVALFLLIACSKNENNSELSKDDFLLFGHFYGECFGEACVEIFRLEAEQLLEDTNDTYPIDNGSYVGQYEKKSDELLNQVSDILDFFPSQLWSAEETVFGCPDCGDWGGVYLEYKKGDQHGYWLLDQAKGNMDESLHEIVDKVNEKIALINQ